VEAGRQQLAGQSAQPIVDERYFAERPRQATSAAGGRVTLIDEREAIRLAGHAIERSKRPLDVAGR
jgi:hypothetical protein